MSLVACSFFAASSAYLSLPGENEKVRIVEGSKGKAVLACRDFQKGAVLLCGWGPHRAERTMYTIQVSRDGHIEPQPPIAFLNHSCAPNCGLLIKAERGILEVHALQNIRAGDELTIDYATFETEISSMSDCLCGQESCRHIIKGFADLSEAQRLNYGPYIAPYLLDK